MNNEQEYCDHCGAKLRKYCYPMAPILVDALRKFYAAVNAKGENSVHLKDDMDDTDNELTRSERSNWTKVRFHGLVAKVKQEDGSQLRGHWLITKRGADFLKGKVSIPQTVWVYRNKVVEHSEEMVTVRDVVGSLPYVDTEIKYELPSQEEVESVVRIKKKARQPKKCALCDSPIKKKLVSQETASGTVSVKEFLVCTRCKWQIPIV